jgi:hypothetical protein
MDGIAAQMDVAVDEHGDYSKFLIEDVGTDTRDLIQKLDAWTDTRNLIEMKSEEVWVFPE